MNVGLILGGGGLVGIAWELGVLAGLQERAGLDPTAMSVVVGTSAGSVVGAQAALGKDLAALVERQLRTPRAAAPAAPAGQIGTRVIPEEIMAMFVSPAGANEAQGRALGKLALDAPVAQEEDDYVASFAGFLGTDEWPASDLRLTTMDCHSGETVLWTREDGIDLIRAVASSCAVPGYFPTVGFAGRRFTDGIRRPFGADLVAEKSLDAVLFVGPMVALPGAFRANPDLDRLAADGLPVVQITGGPALAAIATELMDPGFRAAGAEAGVAEGHAAAADVAALIG